MKYALSILFFAACIVNCSDSTPQSEQKETNAETGKEIYAMYCALCHGAAGDGDGLITLDRPARSFIQGAFSFGNTVDAISKTTSSGIPGTPMPPFAEVLEPDQITLVAKHVRSLAPTLKEATPDETKLQVKNRPVVIRGMLPAVQAGLQLHPRGLLIGNPDGFSYEYRADDVRLLAIRQGEFVQRADWMNRGGSPLVPLGKIIVLVEGGNPNSLFTTSDGTPLRAKLKSTTTLGSYAVVSYELVNGAGKTFATVQEHCVTTTGTRALIEQRCAIHATVAIKIALPTGTITSDSLDVPVGESHRTIIHATVGDKS